MNIHRLLTVHKQLQETQGCLASKKTITSRRRHPQANDEDPLLEGVDPFLIDAELKIAQAKAIRRMLDKTQVMTNPHNLHVRRRITHCGEVTAISSITAAILGLNVELAKAIALGHDMGHTPFGHDGERFLTDITGKNFFHEIMGVVIAQHIERGGMGLNLTHEVLRGFIRDACLDETCGKVGLSEEAKLIAFADRFAYVTGDYNDILRIGYEVPPELRTAMGLLGSNQRERVNTLIGALCSESAKKGSVSFQDGGIAKVFFGIKSMMYEIYGLLNASNSTEVLGRIYEFLGKLKLGVDPALILALMTDQDVLFLAKQPVLDYSSFLQVTVVEMLPTLRKKEIKWWEPDLCW